jgi:hypothetical protein
VTSPRLQNPATLLQPEIGQSIFSEYFLQFVLILSLHLRTGVDLMPSDFQSVLYKFPVSLFNLLLHELHIYIFPFTQDNIEFRLSRLLIIDNDCVVGLLHRVVVGDVANLSEEHASSIFNVGALHYGYKYQSSVAQAVSHWLPTAAARVQTRVWSCGIL